MRLNLGFIFFFLKKSKATWAASADHPLLCDSFFSYLEVNLIFFSYNQLDEETMYFHMADFMTFYEVYINYIFRQEIREVN